MLFTVTLLLNPCYLIFEHVIIGSVDPQFAQCSRQTLSYWSFADLRLTMYDIISGTRYPRDASASRQYSNFFVAFFGILFASRFLLHGLDVLDK